MWDRARCLLVVMYDKIAPPLRRVARDSSVNKKDLGYPISQLIRFTLFQRDQRRGNNHETERPCQSQEGAC
jgi:hypothetical protein